MLTVSMALALAMAQPPDALAQTSGWALAAAETWGSNQPDISRSVGIDYLGILTVDEVYIDDGQQIGRASCRERV